MYSWLIEKNLNIKFYTYLSDVFNTMPEVLKTHDWLFSNYECNFYPNTLKFNTDVFVTGEEILNFMSDDEPQIIWGIISSIKKGERFDLSENKIWSENNPDFWIDEPYIQNKDSEIEITCWDSSAFILMTTNNEISNDFLKGFPNAIDLAKYNKSNNEKRKAKKS